MTLIIICVSFIATILGIAYPILLQVVSKLDEKYASTHIVELFKHEKDWKLFNTFLVSSLALLLIYILIVLPFYLAPQGPGLYLTLILISLLILSTVLLITFFLLFVRKVLIYYSLLDIVKYFIQKDRNALEDTDSPHFNALRDILLFSIRQHNESIALTISDYIYERFQEFNKSHKTTDIEYPFIFYDLIYKVIEELVKKKIQKFSFLEVRTIGGIWLLGKFSNNKVHEITYSWMWRNILLAVEHERDDMIIQYWQQADQHITYNLSGHFNRSLSDSEEPKQKEEIIEEKNRFLEFNYVLGGLLLYKKRYTCIKRLFNYTSSIPPQYNLLPQTLDQVFELYFKFMDPYYENFRFISSRYFFPDTEGFGSEGIVKYWVCRYAATLFLRQYTIIPYLITMQPLDLPSIPSDLKNKKMWIDYLDSFNELVKNVLEDIQSTKILGLDFITEEWCAKNDKLSPFKIFEETISRAVLEFDQIKTSQEISSAKIDKFIETSDSILTNVIEPYQQINNQKRINNESKSWFISGVNTIIDKSTFADNQEAESIDYDSFLPETMAQKFADGISETFVINPRRKYIVKESEIFCAISNLKVNPKKHVIITFGQNLQYYIDTLKEVGLTNNSFNDIELINFPKYNYNIVGDTFFILKKTDLPKIIFHPPDEEELGKYRLRPINRTYNIYGNVIDINLDPSLLKELSSTDSSRDLRKSVYVYIFLKTEIKWEKDISMVALSKQSQFKSQGILTELKEIKSFNSIFK